MTLVAAIPLVAVLNDLDHLFHVIGPQPNIQKIAEHLHLIAEDHRLADGHHYHLDVTGRTLDSDQEPRFVLLVATKLYSPQPHILRTQDLFTRQTPMIPGALGMTAATLTINIGTLIDLVLHQVLHPQIHLQIHLQWHLWDLSPTVYQPETVTLRNQTKPIQSLHTTRMTSTSTK